MHVHINFKLSNVSYSKHASFALNVELMGVILAIEITFNMGWHYLCLKIDLKLVILTFKQPYIKSLTFSEKKTVVLIKWPTLIYLYID
jgi:hypothetical protein